MDINPHPRQGVDKGNGVGPGKFGGSGDFPNISHIGGQFHNQGFGAMFPYRCGNPFHPRAGGAKLYAALLDIWTGNIQFDHVHVAGRQLFRHFTVVFRGIARNVGDHHHILLLEPRQILPDKMLYPRVLQAHCIKHPRRGFRNPGGAGSLPSLAG